MKKHIIELEAAERRIKSASDRLLRNLYKKTEPKQRELEDKVIKKMADKQAINEALSFFLFFFLTDSYTESTPFKLLNGQSFMLSSR